MEGNFAFAQGVHELLLQSRGDYIQVFPAVPDGWQNVSFENLRTEGAFIISAKKEKGVASKVVIKAEKGGVCKIKLPFTDFTFQGKPKKYEVKEGVVEFTMAKGEELIVLHKQK